MAQNFNVNLNLFRAALKVVNELAAESADPKFYRLDPESMNLLKDMAKELGRSFADEIIRAKLAKAGNLTFRIPCFKKPGLKLPGAKVLKVFMDQFLHGIEYECWIEGDKIVVVHPLDGDWGGSKPLELKFLSHPKYQGGIYAKGETPNGQTFSVMKGTPFQNPGQFEVALVDGEDNILSEPQLFYRQTEVVGYLNNL